MKKEILLVDGDELVYKAGYAAQRTEYRIVDKNEKVLAVHSTKKEVIETFGNYDDEEVDIQTIVLPKGEDVAVHSIHAVINTVLADNKPTDYRLYISGLTNFRDDIATLLPYKGTREDMVRPTYYEFIREYLKDEYWAITIEGMEADDALSITQWHHENNDTNWKAIIASQDKDLKMVPGAHYNPSKRIKYDVDPVEARLNFYCQLMSGDHTDNIPGIYRIGDVKARNLLSKYKDLSHKDLYRAVVKAYNQAQANERIRDRMPGDKWGEERILEVARLLWMLQEKDQRWIPDMNYYQQVGLK